MYSMIKKITTRHSRKRRTLRLSISLTSLRREVANRHIQQRTLSPDFSGGLLRGCLHSTQGAVFCQLFQSVARQAFYKNTAKTRGALSLDKTSPRDILKIQKGAVDLTVGPHLESTFVDRTGTSRAVNKLLKAQHGTGGLFETTDKVTIRIIQKIIALISSLFPAINHVIIRILAFFRTCVFLEADFNDFFSGFEPSPVPLEDRWSAG